MTKMLCEIYHPVGSMNHNCTPGQYEYTKVADIEADDLNQAFLYSQNDFGRLYSNFGVRSTSVGDIIRINGQCYLVMNMGFMPVTDAWIRFIDWGNH
jgi:hypothetical protein